MRTSVLGLLVCVSLVFASFQASNGAKKVTEIHAGIDEIIFIKDDGTLTVGVAPKDFLKNAEKAEAVSPLQKHFYTMKLGGVDYGVSIDTRSDQSIAVGEMGVLDVFLEGSSVSPEDAKKFNTQVQAQVGVSVWNDKQRVLFRARREGVANVVITSPDKADKHYSVIVSTKVHRVFVGDPIVIDETDEDQSFVIDRRDIATPDPDVDEDELRIILRAQSAGVAKVEITDGQGQRRTHRVVVSSVAAEDADVMTPEESTLAELIKSQVNEDKLEINFVGLRGARQLVLSGEVSNDDALQRVLQTATRLNPNRDLTPLNFVSLATNKKGADQLGGVQERNIANIIKTLVNDDGLSIGFLGQADQRRLVLQGEVADDIVARQAVAVAQAFFADRVLNFLQIRNPLQIRIKIQVAQITYDNQTNMGLQYRSDPTATGLSFPLNIDSAGAKLFNPAYPFFSVRNLGTGASDLRATLNISQLIKDVKVLQEPTLTVLNGQSATFLVGQRIPYTGRVSITTSGTVVETEFLPVGIQLIITPLAEGPPAGYIGGSAGSGQTVFTMSNPTTEGLPEGGVRGQSASGGLSNVTPSIDRNGLIRLFVRPEISTLLGRDEIYSAPRTLAPRTDVKFVETRVALQDKESLIIGGLFDDESRKNFEKIPFISEIPILGELFKNRANDRFRRELIFVLTPEVVHRETIKKGERYQGTLDGMDKLLRDNNVNILGVKPTRVSASDVNVRQQDSSVVPLRKAEPTPSMPLIDASSLIPPEFKTTPETFEIRSESTDEPVSQDPVIETAPAKE